MFCYLLSSNNCLLYVVARIYRYPSFLLLNGDDDDDDDVDGDVTLY